MSKIRILITFVLMGGILSAAAACAAESSAPEQAQAAEEAGAAEGAEAAEEAETVPEVAADMEEMPSGEEETESTILPTREAD